MAEGKFGFLPEEADESSDLALQFEPTPIVRGRNVAEVDRAAAAAGFVSREAITETSTPVRRRRSAGPPLTRTLSVRMTEAQFTRFLTYADKYELTYTDAIVRLLDEFELNH